jgi:hypothetical protein
MTRSASGGVVPLALLALALALPAAARGQPREIAATVVWVSGDRCYVAARDSSALAPGLLLTLEDHGRTKATGVISGVADRTLAVVRITSGSLARVKKPQRLKVWIETPVVGPLPRLTVGVPQGARSNLVVACAGETPEAALVGLGYRVEMPDAAEWRGVRVARAAGPSWPDTLIVRGYRVATDEEIALERGEIDVAVFWPGERSSRLREDPRWSDAPVGLRARGAIAATEPVATAPADTAGMLRLAEAIRHDGPLAALNPQLMSGDLVPWSRLDSPATAPAPASPSEPRGGAPVTVDDALPGRDVIQRFLDRQYPAAYRDRTRAVHLTCLDLPLAARDSLRAEWRSRGIVPLYALGCPVVAAPERRAYVERLGADAFAELPACVPASPGP